MKQMHLLPISFLISLLSVLLFYKSAIGINMPMFVAVFISILSVVVYVQKRISVEFVINAMLLFLLSIPLAITTAAPVRFIIFLALVYMSCATIYAAFPLDRSISNGKYVLFKYILAPFELAIFSFVSPLLAVSKINVSGAKVPSVILRVGLGMLISVPILLLFILLLASADLVFQSIVGNVFSSSFIGDSFLIIGWLVVGLWTTFGMMHYIFFGKKLLISNDVDSTKQKSSFLFVEAVTVLSLVEILFLIFNIIQITYLFGGETLIQDGDFTYAEYARKGFFELVAVSVIGLGLIGLLYIITKTKNASQKLILRVVSAIGVIELFPMAISAFYKLWMYEEEYGFTRLRMYSHLFIVFLIAIFIWSLVKIVSRLNTKFFVYGVQTIAISAIVVVGFLNIDGLIASINRNNYGTRGNNSREIDIEYLQTLSYDVVPELVNLYLSSDYVEQRSELALYLKDFNDRLDLDLGRQDFRATNLRMIKAKRSLEKVLPEIEGVADRISRQALAAYENKGYGSDSYSYCNSQSNPLYYLSVTGEQRYFNYIEVYKAENPRYFVAKINSSSCIDLDEGSYFFLIKETYGLGAPRVVKAEVNDFRDTILLAQE